MQIVEAHQFHHLERFGIERLRRTYYLLDILNLVTENLHCTWIELLRYMCADAVAWHVFRPLYCSWRADLQNLLDWQFEEEVEEMRIVQLEIEQDIEEEESARESALRYEWMYDSD